MPVPPDTTCLTVPEIGRARSFSSSRRIIIRAGSTYGVDLADAEDVHFPLENPGLPPQIGLD
jgi:hypothetical protein